MPSDAGPHRKYYSLTPAGHDVLDRSAKIWTGFADTMAAVLRARPVAA